jgi:phosphopantothenate synthetase
MNSILKKLTKEEIKELSKAINEAQKDFFGNSLSLRKQEKLMSKVFKQKNWSTVLGITDQKKYDPKSEYQKTVIEVEVLSNGFYDNPNDLKNVAHDITFGDCSGSIKVSKRESLTKQEMHDALINQGSDPSFLITLDSDKINLIDDLYTEVNRLLKYDHQLESCSEEEQVQLIYDYYQKYSSSKDLIIDKLDIKQWINNEY